jgi:membrane fusion protein (multidrug efflux system)
LRQAKLQESYTKVIAPEAGRVTNKSVEAGNYIQVGQPLFAIVPPTVWVTANFKETQLAEMRPGQPTEVEVDAYPARALHGHVDSIQAGSGARFSLLPPENATGNFVKVVQRVPVKIVLDEQPGVQQVLGPGMSAVPDVKVSNSASALIKVVIVAGLALLLLSVATIWWLRRVSTR